MDLNEDSDAEGEEDDAKMSDGRDEEEDEEEEEGDPSEFIDVLDVLDGRGEPEDEDETGGAAKQSDPGKKVGREDMGLGSGDEDEDMDDEDEGSGSEEEDGEDEGEDLVSASEDEDDAGGDVALQELETFVTGLDAGQKRKAPDEDETRDGDGTARARKRRILPERTQAGTENEFAALGEFMVNLCTAYADFSPSGGGKLDLDDLLAPLEGQSSNLQSLKKSAKVLASTSGKIKTLSAPLPQRTAERLDREAAYEQTKAEVDKWKATMQRIQEVRPLPPHSRPCLLTVSLIRPNT